MNDTEFKSAEINETPNSTPEISEEQKFLKALKTVKKGYVLALIISALMAIGAIICSVCYLVSFGILLIILAVVTYLAIVINLLYSKLGIAYRALHGGMTVTALYGKGREVVYIPEKVIMLTVTEIGTRAFTHESSKSIREIHLPKTLLRIGTSAFAQLPALTDVYYEGTQKQWEEISRLAPLENVTMHFEEPIPKIEKPKKAKKKKKK
ncbi:MAG: hypothetical protein E7678_08335 [Ruminococcaceae bacterium]|nr:hypothetical protein [Oscillospiraceae bacterium]